MYIFFNKIRQINLFLRDNLGKVLYVRYSKRVIDNKKTGRHMRAE